MKRKCLAFFYYSGQGGQEIIEDDWKGFYTDVRNLKPVYGDVLVKTPVGCATGDMLRDHIADLIAAHEEVYIHLSGHGNEDGIPLGNWLLQAQDLATFIDNPRVIFCFFSSCRSSILAALANERDIPVVIGTKGSNDIQNKYAIAFQRHFYTELFKGQTFEKAFESGRANANSDLNKNYESGKEILRGEGGRKQIVEDRINALQIVFTSDDDKGRHLLPPDFLSTMMATKTDQPWLLNWFADSLEADDFREAFQQAGFNQTIRYLEIPDDQLIFLLQDNRGENDPFLTENIRLLLHYKKGKEMHEHLYKHLKTEGNISGSNYQVVCCSRESEMDDILEANTILKDKLPETQFFSYKTKRTELFDNSKFVQCIDLHEISHSYRKEIALNFTIKPTKGEIVEIADPDKIVRIFFTNMFYERLINYVVNWIKPRYPENPVLIVDTEIQNNIRQGLEHEISNHASIQFGLKNAFSELLRKGVILVVRKRGGTLEESLLELKQLVDALKYAADGFESNPEKASLIFFQHEHGTDLNVDGGNKLFLKHFTKPHPVDTDMINDWKSKYQYDPLDVNAGQSKQLIAAHVVQIADKIVPAKYSDCCPSAVIDFICHELRISNKKVTELR